MVKNLIIFGTRPEAIKMAPVVKEFAKNANFETKVCVTAQHREMLDQVLEFFEITPDYDLDIMKSDQDLYSLTAAIITELKPILQDYRPDFVYVHGDTLTSTVAALAAFYAGAKICHIEAGLRTYDKWSPFPEEMNRQLTGRLADFHFAPTAQSKTNLLAENISEKNIIVTGNTVVDALLFSSSKVKDLKNKEIQKLAEIVDTSKRILLVTGHRRENHGAGFINICEALKKIATSYSDVQIIYPVHPNPNVRKPVYEMLSDTPNVRLIQPLGYPAFVWLMNQAYLIITDSGGIQEEAPSLGKPVLVMRDTTERPEAVEAGTVLLVGTDKDKIVLETKRLLDCIVSYKKMSELHNPYGDGTAAESIVNFIMALKTDKVINASS